MTLTSITRLVNSLLSWSHPDCRATTFIIARGKPMPVAEEVT